MYLDMKMSLLMALNLLAAGLYSGSAILTSLALGAMLAIAIVPIVRDVFRIAI